jgi:formylglycine-generating enzyme required for sulfatase activity
MLPLTGHADTKKPGAMFKDCETCPEMVVVPAGSFKMGDEFRTKETPVHEVKISYSFAVGKYEITQAEWEAVMGKNPSKYKDAQRPVAKVSWYDAKSFVKKLSEQTGKEYRLLSESEWEYVARAGSTTKYPWGDEIDSSKARYDSDDGSEKGTVPVGSYSANAFGLHDTVGNVWEWVEDCLHENYKDAPTDGSAWLSECEGKFDFRIKRGGSWRMFTWLNRSANREHTSADWRGNYIGLRVARTLSQ